MIVYVRKQGDDQVWISDAKYDKLYFCKTIGLCNFVTEIDHSDLLKMVWLAPIEIYKAHPLSFLSNISKVAKFFFFF